MTWAPHSAMRSWAASSSSRHRRAGDSGDCGGHVRAGSREGPGPPSATRCCAQRAGSPPSTASWPAPSCSGLILNAAAGSWWADPAAGYVLVYYAARSISDPYSKSKALAQAAIALTRAGEKNRASRMAAVTCTVGPWTTAAEPVLLLMPSACRTLLRTLEEQQQ